MGKKWVTKVLQTKYLVSSSVGLTCLYLQDGFAVRWLAGALLNSLLSKILKRLFNQPRPTLAREAGKTDPGFPSSHAHMLFYISVYLALALPHSVLIRNHLVGVSFVVAIVGSVWRVFISRHTVSQVVAGVCSGTFGACLYHFCWETIGVEAFDAFVESLMEQYRFASMLFLVVSGAISFAALLFFSDRITTPSKSINKKK